MALIIRLIGSPSVELDGTTITFQRRKSLALLAYLALQTSAVQRDLLAAIFWPEADQSGARGALRVLLTELKSVLGERLNADRNTVEIVLRPDDSLDVSVFQQAIREKQFEASAALYTDEFMHGFSLPDAPEFDRWQVDNMELLAALAVEALAVLARRSLRKQQYDDAVRYAQRWQKLAPHSERACMLLMGAFTLAGQRAEALNHYLQFERMLKYEIDGAPEPETAVLYLRVRSGETITLTDILPAPLVQMSLPPLPPLVIGRENDLQAIKARLYGTNTGQSCLTIQGWPGVGKSTLLATLAHEPDIHESYPDGVLWANLGESPTVRDHLNRWALALRIMPDHKTDEQISYELVAKLQAQRVLILIDDVWEVQHTRRLLVGGRGCATVISTRRNDIARALSTLPVYKLGVLTADTGLALLRQLSPITVERYPEDAAQLVNDLEGLPLALQVAGRMLAAETDLGWDVRTLLDELRDGTRLLEEQAPFSTTDSGSRTDETSPTIRALLKRSTDHLDDETRERFALLGLFAPKPATFDLEAVAAVWETEDPRVTLRRLVSRGLLEPSTNGHFQMHALLTAHARTMFPQG